MIRVSCDKCVEIPNSKIIYELDGMYMTMTCSICGETITLKGYLKGRRNEKTTKNN